MAPFRPETPRYPNLWLYSPRARFASYAGFVGELRTRLGALGYETNEVDLNEGADLAVSIEHLEPWGDVPGLAHAHALYLVHYEVEHASPLTRTRGAARSAGGPAAMRAEPGAWHHV